MTLENDALQARFLKRLGDMGAEVKEYNEIKPTRGLAELDKDNIDGFTFHHTGVSDRPLVSHHNYHVNERGWVMAGYHFHIRPDGVIEVGRPVWARGAHSKNSNDFSLGVAFSGMFDREEPTPEQYEAGIQIVKVAEELFDRKMEIWGHNDFAETSCPGHKTDLDRIREGKTKDTGHDLTVKINNRKVNFPVKINEEGRTLVKLSNKWVQVREFVEMIPEADISWDEDTRTVKIKIPE